MERHFQGFAGLHKRVFAPGGHPVAPVPAGFNLEGRLALVAHLAVQLRLVALLPLGHGFIPGSRIGCRRAVAPVGIRQERLGFIGVAGYQDLVQVGRDYLDVCIGRRVFPYRILVTGR